MKTISKVFVLSLFALSAASAYAAPDAAMQTDDQAINNACSADAKTAGCGSEIVGKGLLKCLHSYKKGNPTFKLSPDCKTAMKQRRSDKKAGK